LVASLNPTVFGELVNFTATVGSTGGSIPTGNVTFLDGAVSLGSVALDATGHATVATSTLSIGTHSIAAAYAGDTTFAGSTSAPLSQVVQQLPVDTTPPTITCPGNLTVHTLTPQDTCVAVTYPLPTATDAVSATTLTCVPPPGACFPIGTTVVNCEAKDAAGNTAVCAFTITVTSAPARCPQERSFWQKHPEAWPVQSLILGAQAYNQAQLLALMQLSNDRDASITLVRALIAAKLNIANGSDPAPIAATIAESDGMLSKFKGGLPYQVRPLTPLGRTMTQDGAKLASYDNGALTPGCGDR
jgi:hypothetical protein